MTEWSKKMLISMVDVRTDLEQNKKKNETRKDDCMMSSLRNIRLGKQMSWVVRIPIVIPLVQQLPLFLCPVFFFCSLFL